MIPRFNLTAALLFAALVGSISYGPLFFRAPPLERDDEQLLAPLYAVNGPADYFRAWKEGRVLDVAPLRDATFLVDTAATRALGSPTFTFTNFALWLIFTALALSLFSALGFGDSALWLLTITLACHPVYVVSVAWIASRKHLLAGVFCLAATLSLVKGRRGAATWYALSVLSHPMHLLWPLFAALFSRCDGRRAPLAALAVMIPLSAINGWYYLFGPYLAASRGLGKFLGEEGLATGALAFGRATWNLLLPLSLSPVDYQPESAANFAGLALLVAFFFAAAKLVPARKLLPWATFFALPLLLLNLRPTRIFLSDTYLLVPSLGLWAIVGFALPQRWVKPALALGAVLGAAGIYGTRALAASFSSTENLFALAYEREPTPQVAYVHAKFLFEAGYLREAAETAFLAIPDFPPAAALFAQAVASDDKLSVAKRLELLGKVPLADPFVVYFHAVTLAKAGRAREAWAEASPLLKRFRELGGDAPKIADGLRNLARAAGAWSPDLDARLALALSQGDSK